MADLTTITVTIRGSVGRGVVTLAANGVPVTLNPNHTFAHDVVFAAGSSHLTISVNLTTVDSTGHAETRAILVEREDVPVALSAPG